MPSSHLTLLQHFVKNEIPLGSNILLMGPPGVGKTVFCESLICETVKNGSKSLYITLDHNPEDVRRRVHFVEGNCPLTFVDGYSWLIGITKERYRVTNLSNLSDLSVKMISATSEMGKGSFFVFDSISTLLIYNSENEVVRFLEVNMARMKHSENIGIWIVERGIHSEAFYYTIRHMCDGVLDMRFEEHEGLSRFIRMHTFRGISHNTEWRSFNIGPNGEFAINS